MIDTKDIRGDMPQRFSISLNDNQNPIITDDVALFLEEIDLILSTQRGEVLFDFNFGSDLEDMLWKTNLSNTDMERVLTQSITDNCFMGQFFEWSVTFELAEGSVRDIGILSINITDQEGTKLKAQTILK